MSRHQNDISSLQNKIAALEQDLLSKESELEHEKQVKEELLSQSFANAQSQDTERKKHEWYLNRVFKHLSGMY